MHPTIENGEVITVEPVEPSEVEPGDIVLYRRRSGAIAHRVVGVERSGEEVFLLAGDASSSCDSPVRPHQILGRVVSIEHDCRCADSRSRRARMWHALHTLLTKIGCQLEKPHNSCQA
ncbi:MAG: hypothetical protein ACREMO_01785 [Gemmatimonadales bacterium]